MKIEISDLADSLFWCGACPQGFDLDTGEVYDVDAENGQLVGMKRTIKYNPAEKFPRIRILPYISPAPIYQNYMLMLQEKLGVQFGSWFDNAPLFKFNEYYPDESISEDLVRAENEFMDKTSFLDEGRSYGPLVPRFIDYWTEQKIQFAKKWCEKEGYEWYEE